MARLLPRLAIAAPLLLAVPVPALASGSPDPAAARARVAATARLDALAPLLEALAGDPAPLVRAAAAEALGRRRDPTAAPALAAALVGDADPGVRAEAARALAALARRVDPHLFARAGLEYLPEDAHIRRDRALPPEAVTALARAAADPSAAVRRVAIRSLGQVGPPAADAWPAAAERLAGDDQAPIRALAAQALGRLGRTDAVGALLRALDDPAIPVRLAAARALRRLAAGADGTQPPPALRDAAIGRLAHLAAGDAAAAVRAAALEALVALVPQDDARAAVPALVAALDDPAGQVRTAAADSLLALGPPEVPDLDLDRRLASEEGAAARAALHALAAALRPAGAAPHLDALVDALADPAARRAAERALVRLGRAGLPAAATLRARLGTGPAAGGGPDDPVARALARVEAGGPLVLPGSGS